MSELIAIRSATAADLTTLARHCAEMYRDMGVLPEEQYRPLYEASCDFLSRAMPAGDYLAWVAVAEERVVGGVGLQLRWPLPGLRRRGEAVEITRGPHGLLCNVFTERAWRRRGIGRRLTETVIDEARARGVSQLFLHASSEGRPLYEHLGFVPTNEMRYAGTL
jgi:GNAT superfamily N-acetyltransferase